jgi:hypothetical protein
MRILGIIVLFLVSLTPTPEAQSLRGSKRSMQEQFNEAKENDLTRLRTPAQVEKFEDLGLLVELKGSASYRISGARFPVARPSVKLFVDRLAPQYRVACGEKLVVTSLTRPINRQPRNASKLSVHPAGMSVDLRISRKPSCRAWLEKTLLQLERADVIEATRERRPPHYHVAVFPDNYRAYVKRRDANTRAAALKRAKKQKR